MATTSPDNIWTQDSTDNYDLVVDAAATAASIQAALVARANSYTGTTAQRTAFTSSAPEGTTWADTNGEKIYWIKQGSGWSRMWSAGDNVVVIGGVSYQAAGVFPAPPAYSFNGSSPVFYASWTYPRPYTPPAGYGFIPHITRTGRYATVAVGAAQSEPLEIRYTQVYSSSVDINLRLGWRLLPV